MDERPSRIAEAHRRVDGTKQLAVAGAAAAFLVIALLARAGNPGQAGTSSGSSGNTAGSSQSTDSGFGFGSGFAVPSDDGAPDVQTGVS